MRICVLCEFFHPGKAVLTPLFRYLKAHYADLDVEVITTAHMYLEKPQRLPAYEEWEGIRIHRLASPQARREAMSSRVLAGLHLAGVTTAQLLRNRPYDLLFVLTTPPVLPLAAYLIKRWRRTPFVYLIHDLYPDIPVGLGALRADGLPARISRKHQQHWLRAADRVIVLGRCMKEHLITAYGLPPEKIALITNWGDENCIKAAPLAESHFREKNQLQGFVVLYAGNLGLQQDFETILDAAALLERQQAPVQFCLVGEGGKKEKLQQRIAQQGPHNVCFFPYVPVAELSDMLAAANATLITLEPGMEQLGVPSKLYSVLASGRPVLAILGAGSEVAQILQDGACGFRVDHGASEKLAETILTLLRDPQLAEDMGRRARQLFEARYTLPRVAAQYYELFQAVLTELRPEEKHS